MLRHRFRHLAILSSLLTIAFLGGHGLPTGSASRAQNLSSFAVLRDVEYANVGGRSLRLDLYLPDNATAPLPLIVWVHGGGWVSGNKNLSANGAQVRQTARGYALASIEYRLSSVAQFPAQINDCKAAIRWLRANAARFNLDPNRIGVWGSSAGGHLVALLGTSGGVSELEGEVGGNLEFSSRVQAVVDWYGPANLLTMEAQDLPCSLIDHNSILSPESLLIGCAVQSCAERARAASPTHYVTPDEPPFLLMHGTNDCLVPPLQSQELFDLLRANGVAATLRFIQGEGHGGTQFTNAENTKLVDDFFDLHLAASQEVEIIGASISGKKLIVSGANFDGGATVFINGAEQKTKNDATSPTTRLIAKKGGKQIAQGQMVTLQVKNADGRESQPFSFTRQ